MAKFYLEVEIRLVNESCPRCWGPMWTYAFFNINDLFSYISGNIPKCMGCGHSDSLTE